MSPILGIFASSQQGSRASSYDSIQTVTVGAGGASSISFTSIPGTYKHLQIRGISRDTRTGTGEQSVMMQFNGDTGTNYSYHILEGYGSGTPTAGPNVSTTQIKVSLSPTSSASANMFGGFVADILDYSNTSKYKVSRSLYGDDQNGSGTVAISSGVWNNLNSLTSITIYPTNSQSFVQYSKFALYGIKG